MAASAVPPAPGRFDQIVATLKTLTEEETLVVRQAGRRIPHPQGRAAPIAIASSASCRTGRPGTHFNELDKKGLAMYGQMTYAGSLDLYRHAGHRGSTYETFVEAGRQHYNTATSGASGS